MVSNSAAGMMTKSQYGEASQSLALRVAARSSMIAKYSAPAQANAAPINAAASGRHRPPPRIARPSSCDSSCIAGIVARGARS